MTAPFFRTSSAADARYSSVTACSRPGGFACWVQAARRGEKPLDPAWIILLQGGLRGDGGLTIVRAPEGFTFQNLASERGAAWLAHQSGGLGVVGSNPAAPTSQFFLTSEA